MEESPFVKVVQNSNKLQPYMGKETDHTLTAFVELVKISSVFDFVSQTKLLKK